MLSLARFFEDLMRKFPLSTLLPHLAAVAIFLLLIFSYFPELLDNKSLRMDDIEQHKGMSNELADYREKTGEEAIWTNAMFGGMPGYVISVVYHGNLIGYIGSAIKLGLPRPADSMFVLMLGIYILLLSLKVRPSLAVLGSAAYCFTSYNLLIMEAGHMSKVDAISWMPWVLAGVLMALNGRWLAGSVFTALFLSLQIKSSHFQITYYLGFIILFVVIAYLVEAFRQKNLPAFGKAVGGLTLAAALAVASNISSLYTIYDYGKDSIRGKSELTIREKPDGDGLDKDYALDYSYGRGETFSYMIPNIYGGASNLGLGDQKDALKEADDQYRDIMAQMPQYWAETSTTGPFYAGAIVVFLCVLGFLLVQGPLRWAILASMLLAIVLSWGKNFEGFSVFMLENFPGYNKFRAVKITLIITDFLIPLMAVLGLNEVLKKPEVLSEKKWILPSAFLATGGLSLLFYLLPDTFFSFDYLNPGIQDQLMRMLGQSGFDKAASQTWIEGFIGNMEEVRMSIFRADAMRSFLLISLGAAAVFAYQRFRFNPMILTALLIIAVVGDLFSVNKRYVNKKDFVPNSKAEIPYEPSAADEAIYAIETQKTPGLLAKIEEYKNEGLSRKNRRKSGNAAADENKYRYRGLLANTNYRVLNLSTSTFNDAATSFFHKSVGGYSAVKLERYQELIEFEISAEMQQVAGLLRGGLTDSMFRAAMGNLDVLNMLNTRYIIYNPEASPLVNPAALGNAWLVKQVRQVKNADEEIQALGQDFNPAETAIVDQRFGDQVNAQSTANGEGVIRLESYAPNLLKYTFESSAPQIAVFSEIYYAKGWNAYIDGNLSPHFRCNYVLRGLKVPAGKHSIEFRFEPKLYKQTETISYASSSLILLLVALMLFLSWKQTRSAAQ